MIDLGDIEKAESFRDLLRNPPSSKRTLILPRDQSPAGAVRVESSFWDPSIGSPMGWLGRLTLHKTDAAEPDLIASYQFLAPEPVARRHEDRWQGWLALGSWFVGRMIGALGKDIPFLDPMAGGAPRSYQFRRGEATFGLLDVLAVDESLRLPVEVLDAALYHHLIDYDGSAVTALARAETWERELMPQLEGAIDIQVSL